MKMLALEFSSAQRSVAAAETNASAQLSTLCEVVETGPGAMHALAMVEDVLRQARFEREQVDRLIVGLGPGSYTGIRCAISLAQGWNLGSAVTLLGISSMDCLAEQAFRNGIAGRVHTVVDAQRNELYLATYEATQAKVLCVQPLKIVSRSEAEQRVQQGGTVVGPESAKWFTEARLLSPSASVLCYLAAGISIAPHESTTLEPIYLRQPSFVKAPPPRAGLSL